MKTYDECFYSSMHLDFFTSSFTKTVLQAFHYANKYGITYKYNYFCIIDILYC